MPLSDAQYLDSSPATDGEEIRKLLDSRLDREKLEGMKHLIALISLGHDASEFFPSVVKNVVAVGVELKRMVYMYLVHYAADKQEIALLSINSFQKDLSDPNQLIRALALRVMSSIRLDITIQVVMLSIKKCAKDSSAYVRKTAAHAIPKLFDMDADQREPLIEVIMDLMRDPSTLVIGSAVAAFQEVCPDRMDLVHGVFRRLCVVLADTDEWGQVVIIKLLAHYARSQFMDPNKSADAPKLKKKNAKKKQDFYSDSDGSENEDEGASINSDHRLLLKATIPLLQSRNSGVVIAVAMLHFATAPEKEIKSTGVAKAMIRCSRIGREHAYIFLSSIESIASGRPKLFRPFLKEFYVNGSDTGFVRNLKLDIMTHIACRENVFPILTEFHQYVKGGDPKLMAATIQAMGRAAVKLKDPEVTSRCLRGLIVFLSSPQPSVVSQSVFVLRNLVMVTTSHQGAEQPEPSGKHAVRCAAQLLFGATQITDPAARGCIVWLLGEYADWLPQTAADSLRQLAKVFIEESEDVKLQSLSLASKLYVRKVERSEQITAYIFEMARYDTSFDVRDRTRVLRSFLGLDGDDGPLQQEAASVIRCEKPAPSVMSRFEDRHMFTLGSLSFMVNHEADGYMPLPDFSETPSDSSLRVADAASSKFSSEFVTPATNNNVIKRAAPEVAASMHTNLDQFYDQGGGSSSSSDDGDDTASASSSNSGDGGASDGSGSGSGSGTESSGSSSSGSSSDSDSGSESSENEQSVQSTNAVGSLLDFGMPSEGASGGAEAASGLQPAEPQQQSQGIDLLGLMEETVSYTAQQPVMTPHSSSMVERQANFRQVRPGPGMRYPLLRYALRRTSAAQMSAAC
jgi:AP-3 complex subunit beta